MTDMGAFDPVMPEVALAVLVLVIVTVDGFLKPESKHWLTWITVAGLIVVGIRCALVWETGATTAFGSLYTVDKLSVVLKGGTVAIGILAAIFGPSYLRSRRLPLGEFNAILVFSLLGMFVLASSADLITLFIGLELMVMPAYLLTGFHKTDRYSNEGGLKYFLLGSFASAILLMGIAWTYGVTGTVSFAGISEAVSGPMNPAMLLALALLMVGATFKVAAVPFHYWTPDAYQGAPTPITGFLSVGPKLGAFALLLRLFAEALAPARSEWLGVLLALTVLTMTVGNVVALTQNNVKRMLAYSSIAHTGYILAGLAVFAATDDPAVASQGISAILFYLVGYGIMNIAAFAVVGILQKDPKRFGGLASFAGLARREPWLAAGMTVLLLSLTGIPPTVGFFAKLYVLLSVVNAGLVWLAAVIALNAALAAFYYLRVVVYMYMRDPEDEPAPIERSLTSYVGLGLSVTGVIVLGLFPSLLLEWLQAGAASLF